jgi:putative addiction module CopG family antidote
MTTVNVSLPEAMEGFVAEQVQKHGYGDAGEYLRALIREAQARSEREEIDAKLLEGIRSGSPTPVTAQTWAEIARAGMARLAAQQGE